MLMKVRLVSNKFMSDLASYSSAQEETIELAKKEILYKLIDQVPFRVNKTGPNITVSLECYCIEIPNNKQEMETLVSMLEKLVQDLKTKLEAGGFEYGE